MANRGGTQDRVIESAAKLFLQRGFHEVSMDRVAEQAGVTKVTIYQHFVSKEDLLERCLKWRLERRESALDHVLSSDLKPAEALLRIFSWMEENAQKQGFSGCAFLKATSEVALHKGKSGIREVAKAAKQSLRDRCTVLASAAGCADAAAVGSTCALLIDGAQALSLIEQSAEPFRAAREAAEALLFQHTGKR